VKLAFRSQKEVNGGNIVILHGIDANISHSATAVGSTKKNKIDEDDDDEEEEEEICFKPLRFDESVVKLSIEPLRPAELPKMVQVRFYVPSITLTIAVSDLPSYD